MEEYGTKWDELEHHGQSDEQSPAAEKAGDWRNLVDFLHKLVHDCSSRMRVNTLAASRIVADFRFRFLYDSFDSLKLEALKEIVCSLEQWFLSFRVVENVVAAESSC
jgi:hypothetical protein